MKPFVDLPVDGFLPQLVQESPKGTRFLTVYKFISLLSTERKYKTTGECTANGSRSFPVCLPVMFTFLRRILFEQEQTAQSGISTN